MTMKDTRKYKQTELGLLPEDWDVAKLGNIGYFLKGNGISKSQANSGNLCAVRYGELYTLHHNYIKTYNSHISKEVALFSTKIQRGDILFACSGETKEEIGKCAAFVDEVEAYAGGDVLILRTDQEKYSDIFLGFLLNMPTAANQKAAKGQGDAVVHISKTALENLSIPLPPIEEQRRIASALTSIDNLIDSLDRLIAKKRDIKQGAMQQLLSVKKRLKGFTEPWVEKKLGDVVTNSTGLTYSPNNVKKYGTLVLRSSNIKNGKLIFEDNVFVEMSIPERAKVHTNDLLVCVRNGSKALIGKSAVITEDAEGMAFGAFMTILRANGIEQIFLNYYWQTDFVQKQVRDNIGATINQITNADISDFDIYVPSSLTEQQAIAAVLTSMDNELSALEAKRKKYEQIKQGMMQQLLTGRIRLENASMVH